MNEQLPRVLEGVMKVFAAYTRGYVRRNFHALRILKTGLPFHDGSRPVVIFLNHAAWWDPLVCLLLAREFFPNRTSFAPIDSAMFGRYGFFKYLGFFGVEPGTPRGARTFLRTARAILASPRDALWLTPQGRFVDVRERPLRLQNGLGALAAREPDAIFIPLAIEYAFWTEPHPEILVSFGRNTGFQPVRPAGFQPAVGGRRRQDACDPNSLEGCATTADKWTSVFTDALETTQNELAAHSCRRDPAEWLTLNRGKSGVNGIYDGWRWVRARMRGEKFAPEHPADEAQ